MSLRGYATDWHGRCPYCGVRLTVDDREAITQRSKDHIIPRRCGGQTTHRNLVYACLGCNRDKHHLSLLEWRVVRAMRLQSPVLAWDRDLPGVLWKWLIFNVYYSGSLSKLLILN